MVETSALDSFSDYLGDRSERYILVYAIPLQIGSSDDNCGVTTLYNFKSTIGPRLGVQLAANLNFQLLRTQNHSRLQSLRSFWPAAGIESSGSNHYESTKEITEFWLSGSLRICIYGACLKWLLPELSIPAAGQKDRRLWGRE